MRVKSPLNLTLCCNRERSSVHIGGCTRGSSGYRSSAVRPWSRFLTGILTSLRRWVVQLGPLRLASCPHAACLTFLHLLNGFYRLITSCVTLGVEYVHSAPWVEDRICCKPLCFSSIHIFQDFFAPWRALGEEWQSLRNRRNCYDLPLHLEVWLIVDFLCSIAYLRGGSIWTLGISKWCREGLHRG